jgi:hypothetical protein
MECFLKWFGAIASIATLVSLVLYLSEKHKRRNDSSMTIGFLHGIKPSIHESSILEQINDMIARLNPPKSKKGKREK